MYFRRTLDAKKKLSTKPSRAILFEFSLSSTRWRVFDKPEDLGREFFIGLGRRHLIVLEDISREWVECLGPRLGIPVSVFALHWANPIDHVNGEVRVPIGESPARHFILNYRQSLPFTILDRQTEIIVDNVKKGQLGE